MQRITRLAMRNRGGLSPLSPIHNKSQLQLSLFMQARRRVSMQCWDAFGNLRDGTDLVKRDSVAWVMWHKPVFWRVMIVFMQFGPAIFILWCNGVFDYMFRRRLIKPLEPDFTAEYPYRPQDPDYENPLFEPARKHAKVLERKRARRAYQQERFDEITKIYEEKGLSAALSCGIKVNDKTF